MKTILMFLTLSLSTVIFGETRHLGQSTDFQESWQCSAYDNTGRSFTGFGSSQSEAMNNAISQCRAYGEARSCGISSCNQIR
ncbi:MAG: hypothetical protein AB7T49_10290 [Oligoflexales bacterium]